MDGTGWDGILARIPRVVMPLVLLHCIYPHDGKRKGKGKMKNYESGLERNIQNMGPGCTRMGNTSASLHILPMTSVRFGF